MASFGAGGAKTVKTPADNGGRLIGSSFNDPSRNAFETDEDR